MTSPTPSLVGRRSELHRILTAFRQRNARLVFGPRGAGKTSLLQSAIAHLPAAIRANVLAASQPYATPAGLVAALLDQLQSIGAQRRCARLANSRSLPARAQSALLIEVLSAAKHWIVLDSFAPASPAIARVMKHILTRAETPIYIAARSASTADLGHASSLYWSSEMRIELGALAQSSARELVVRETAEILLAASELADFRACVLRVGKRIPGPMLEMCRLAKDPRYHSHSRLKSALLQIDARIAAHGALTPRADSQPRRMPAQRGAQ